MLRPVNVKYLHLVVFMVHTYLFHKETLRLSDDDLTHSNIERTVSTSRNPFIQT